jgi:alkylation response protein AidB-like acyl-CoA dehydrogenase
MATNASLTAIRIPGAYGLAAGAINAGTEAEKQALLPGIVAGDTTATFAWVEDNGRWDAEGSTALTATAEGGETVLNGHRAMSSTATPPI